MTMDYSPWSEREFWPFLKVVISPKLEKVHPPKLVCMHVTLIPTSINFLSQSMVRKENLVVFEGSNISETRMATPTKIGVHAFDIKLYLYDFFELIPID